MSKILSYNNKSTGEGWFPLSNQYSADEVGMISDPNAGLSQQPRTAIPSPFAQMDLVKNAFKRLAANSRLQGELMDEKLVANALDVAQLFFNLGELRNTLKVVVWNRQIELPKLLASPQHTLLGETLSMFLEQDKEAFNFGQLDKLYFLVCGNKVVGGTSPISLFMASPNAKEHQFNLPVEQNVNVFSLWRPLYARDEKFIRYFYALFTAFPQLKRLCGEVNDYLIANFKLLDTSLRTTILSDIGNPEALDLADAERAKGYLEANFTMIDEGVQVLGVPLYCAKKEDIEKAILASDFMMLPSRQQEDKVPLVLQNKLNTFQSDPFRYITANWDDATVIRSSDYALPIDKRTLPATTHQYPWVTVDDFLQPNLVKLDYTQNRDCFFDGNLSVTSMETDDCDFLLPIKPLYFKYFDVKDLWGTISGKPCFELIHNRSGQVETVKAVLRIPVRKTGAYITLERIYETARQTEFAYDEKNDRGFFVTVPFAVSIFPFVRTQGLLRYSVQLIDRALGLLDNYSLSVDFCCNGGSSPLGNEDVVKRERSLKSEKRVGSVYYSVARNFDFMQINLSDERGNRVAQGVVCPRWHNDVPGHDAFTFAVDFGTTNTHVECMKGENMPEPLKITSTACERLVATLYNGDNLLYDAIMKQEFLPKLIGDIYGFPQRTVLSECERLDAENVDDILAPGDANIPFVYEKESIGYGNRIVANLKWSTEVATGKRVRAYLRELARLMATKVLIEKGDLTKTRLVWFYPLAMKVGNIRKLGEMWAQTFAEVFGVPVNEGNNLIQMPESVAPYYFYKGSGSFRGAASTVAGIDIGGGSSDVVVFGSNATQPTLLTSFRFAANVLFGDGFSEVPHGDTNPMLVKYMDYFKRLFDANDDKYGELHGILDDIAAKRKSEEMNAFLFSVVNNKVVGGNDVFSYNKRLNEDGTRKIIFLYFYAALIYYVAKTMRWCNVDKPRSVMFSGTGSKVLDIVGNQRELDLFTRIIFEKVYGERYDADGFSVVMERREPKQITCRGALMQVRDQAGCRQVTELNELMDDFDSTLCQNYSLLDKETLCYGDMDNAAIRAAIVNEVKAFNDFFCMLCDEIRVTDRFLVDTRALATFKEVVNKDLEHHLINGWNFVNKNQTDKNANDPIEDTLFFYPIIGSIRDNLIEHLKEE